MQTTDILRGWKSILSGRTPFLSIEITKECPLACPGCYAYGDEHLGGAATLRQVSDFKGQGLVCRSWKSGTFISSSSPARYGQSPRNGTPLGI
jgi:hypothetical protein